jgi:hypothetical protein
MDIQEEILQKDSGEKELNEKDVLVREIAGYMKNVSLLENPLLVGIDGLNSQLAIIQGNRDRMSEILSDAIWEKSQAEIQLSNAKFVYDQKYSINLLKEEVLSLKNVAQQKAKASETILKEIMGVLEAENILLRVDAFCKICQNAIANIDSKYNSLSKQINNIERGLANGIYHKEDLLPQMKSNCK